MIKTATISAFVLLAFASPSVFANDSRSLTVPRQPFPNQNMMDQHNRDRFMRNFRANAPVISPSGEPARLIGGGGGGSNARPTPIKPIPKPVQPVKPVKPTDPISKPLPIKKPNPVSKPLPVQIPIERPAPVTRSLPSRDPVPNIRNNDNRGGLVNKVVRKVKDEVDRRERKNNRTPDVVGHPRPVKQPNPRFEQVREERPVGISPIERRTGPIVSGGSPTPRVTTPVPTPNPVIVDEDTAVGISPIERLTPQQFYQYEEPRENQNIRRMNNVANTLSNRIYYDQIREHAEQVRRQNNANNASSFQQRRQQQPQNRVTVPSRFSNTARTPSRYGSGGGSRYERGTSRTLVAPSRF